MAIEKLNLDWKNKGETGYENSKMDKVKMGDITDKIDEIIDSENVFDTHNFGTASGYQKFPSGLILQWWSFDMTLDSTEKSQTVQFPLVFPTTALNGQATISDPGQGSTRMTSNVGVRTMSATGITIRLKSTNDYVNGQTVTIRWLAIGH